MNPEDPGRPEGPLRQLIGSVSALLATAIGIGRTRLELLTVELREELNRTAGLLVWGAVAVLAAGGGVLFAGLAIIFAFWDTHRILAAGLVTLGYFVLAAVAGLVIRSRLRSRPPFLQATLGELARDEDGLRGQSR
ncbi:MAG: phage holin family protein [Chromatiales bacterium]|nr:phage holin family protein [Chromatiales bacterium]